jgi:hypothetical protein
VGEDPALQEPLGLASNEGGEPGRCGIGFDHARKSNRGNDAGPKRRPLRSARPTTRSHLLPNQELGRDEAHTPANCVAQERSASLGTKPAALHPLESALLLAVDLDRPILPPD